MKMIPDRTGRFLKRPYWETAELEGMCEGAICFRANERLTGRNGKLATQVERS